MEKLLVIGASGHARAVIEVVEREGRYQIVGVIDDSKPRPARCLAYAVLGGTQQVPRLASELGVSLFFVAIGDNWARFQVTEQVQRVVSVCKLATAIHPSAQIARSAEIGEGTVAMPGAIVHSAARIGSGCILNTASSIDHDSRMGDFSSLAPGATVGGDSHLGDFGAVGLGANVVHGVRIGEHTVVGAGSLVLDDLPPRTVAYGSPTRVIRARREGETYL